MTYPPCAIEPAYAERNYLRHEICEVYPSAIIPYSVKGLSTGLRGDPKTVNTVQVILLIALVLLIQLGGTNFFRYPSKPKEDFFISNY